MPFNEQLLEKYKNKSLTYEYLKKVIKDEIFIQQILSVQETMIRSQEALKQTRELNKFDVSVWPPLEHEKIVSNE